MDRKTFWDLIAEARSKRSPRKALAKALGALPAESILNYYRVYNDLAYEAYSETLWGAGYLINGGCSDDGFYYFRCWLVERGREAYEAALRHPDNLADYPDGDENLEGDAWDCAAREVWTKKTKRSENDFFAELERLPSAPEGNAPDEGWDFDDDDEVRRRLPRLSKMYLDRDGEDENDD
jgi:Protein of unknown function (DUF4240)